MFIKYCLLQISYWCAYGSFIAYLVPYLNSLGYDSKVTGTIMALFALTAMFGQILFGALCDKIKSIKKVYLFNNAIVILFVILIFLLSGSMKLIIIVALGFVQLPMPVMIDSWVIQHYHETPEKYGPIRASASLAYALFSGFFGYIVVSMGYIAMPIYTFVFLLISLITAMIIKESKYTAVSHQKVDFKVLMNKNFTLLLIFSLMLGLSAGTVLQMQSYIVYSVHATDFNLGICIAISSIVQVPVMTLYPYMKKTSQLEKMTWSVLLYLGSFFLFLFGKNIYLIYVGMGLNGIGFALYLPAIRDYVARKIPFHIQTTSLSLIDSMQNNLGCSIGIFGAGILIANYGVSAMLTMCILFAGVGLVLLKVIQ